MGSEFTVEDIIQDLRRLGEISGVTVNPDGEIPENALFYTLLNYGAIEFCLGCVYKGMSETQRKELCQTHEELHDSAIESEFYEVASDALRYAKNYWMKGFSRAYVSKDDLQMLIRGLMYAKYVSHTIPRLFIPSSVQRRGQS